MPSFQLREAAVASDDAYPPIEPSDADAVATLFHAFVREAGAREYSAEQIAEWSPSKPDPKIYLRQAQGRIFLVAVDADGRLLGYGDLEPNGHIDHLYCHPDMIETGVGSAIYAALEAAARRAGITGVLLKRTKARAAYLNVADSPLMPAMTSRSMAWRSTIIGCRSR